jgi:spermidine synthase
MLARKGHEVTVVDIDPMARHVARRFFQLDSRIEWVTADGLTFLVGCRHQYDAIVLDACTSDGTVDGFAAANWIEMAMSKITPGGVLMLNLAYGLSVNGMVPTDGFGLSEKLSSRGFYSVLLRPEEGWEGNEILMVSYCPKPIRLRRSEIMRRPVEARSYLLSLRFYRRKPSQPRLRTGD